METKIQNILKTYPRKKLLLPTNCKKAAVLLPLFKKKEEWHILFTKRSQKVGNHKGQISFPGGRIDPEDETLVTTALRETTEELGISGDCVKILGTLNDVNSIVSSFIVTPFVGILPQNLSLKINKDEIDFVFDVPLNELIKPELHFIKWKIYKNQKFLIHYYQYENHLIWGVTGNILRNFLEILEEIKRFRKHFLNSSP